MKNDRQSLYLVKPLNLIAYSDENGHLYAAKRAACPGQIGHPIEGWGWGGVGLDLV